MQLRSITLTVNGSRLLLNSMKKQPRVISLVPSWTEMLISLDIPIVGRTRFCTEPQALVQNIPSIGGTKDWDFSALESLNPTLLILDKEENPKFMSEGHSIPFVATHVQDLESCAVGIKQISQALEDSVDYKTIEKLDQLADRWNQLAMSSTPTTLLGPQFWTSFRGVIKWIQMPTRPIEHVYYVIWKNPWMVASSNTFIGALFSKIGVSLMPQKTSPLNRYPEIVLDRLDKESTLLFFSSEPYPFDKKILELEKLGFASAVVDGQSFSWFGLRSLLFLESYFKKSI